MLVILLVWFYIFFSCIGTTKICIIFFGLKESNLFVEFLIGLAVLGAIFSYSSILTPTRFNGLFCLPLFIYGLIVVGKNIESSFKAIGILEFLLFGVVFLVVLLQASKTPFVTDVGLYHAQTIRWSESFPVVSGLGNLHGRLAFNSVFHILVSSFGFSFFNNVMLHGTLSSFCLLLGLIYMIKEAFHSNNLYINICSGTSIILLLSFYRDWISSPTPDILVTILILTITFVFIDSFSTFHSSKFPILILSVFAVTVKLSSLPIVLLPVILIVRSKFDFKSLLKYSALLLFFLLPFFVRNYYLSGYLVYPFAHMDLFDVPWKIPYELVIRESEWVKSFARTGSYDLQWFSTLTFKTWLPIWWSNQMILNKLLIFSILFLLCILPVSIVLRKNDASKKAEKYLLTAMLLGVVFWFLMAPYLRFGHGFIIAFISVGFYLFISGRRFLDWVVHKLLILGLLAWGYSFYREVKEGDYQFISPSHYNNVELINKTVGDNTYYLPYRSNLCWDSPLPCTPDLNDQLKQLGATMDCGFAISISD
ncbi:hypothetical protein [Reichenbachiella sp. MALMAid0571]|uniref:LIC_10190 family membrane protein n=1 Tax=Reichenbachiella sp. MALMAid0571 TaxID=3143939 RepID=UPI0032E0099C